MHWPPRPMTAKMSKSRTVNKGYNFLSGVWILYFFVFPIVPIHFNVYILLYKLFIFIYLIFSFSLTVTWISRRIYCMGQSRALLSRCKRYARVCRGRAVVSFVLSSRATLHDTEASFAALSACTGLPSERRQMQPWKLMAKAKAQQMQAQQQQQQKQGEKQ